MNFAQRMARWGKVDATPVAKLSNRDLVKQIATLTDLIADFSLAPDQGAKRRRRDACMVEARKRLAAGARAARALRKESRV